MKKFSFRTNRLYERPKDPMSASDHDFPIENPFSILNLSRIFKDAQMISTRKHRRGDCSESDLRAI